MSEKRSKNRKSKEEIAREFVLPERKSKIATIMKQDGQAYCICRSSDCSRFMIGCDGCEEWYHGDCIKVTEKEAKHIKHYYCQRCKQEDPELHTIFRTGSGDRSSHQQQQQQQSSQMSSAVDGGAVSGSSASVVGNTSTISANNAASSSMANCGNCDGCRSLNCGECDPCLGGNKGNRRCVKRVCLNPSTGSKVKRHTKPAKDRQRKRRRSVTPEIYLNPELEGLRQCYGPSCRRNARPQSKYCSDDCGIRLATNRIFQVLPQRIQEWNLTPCHAEKENAKQLEQIRTKQNHIRSTLAELDNRHLELDALIERVKQSGIDPNRQQDNSDAEDEQSMYCITCGHEIHSRTAIKHMEKCFNKYEAQATFGSIFKTRIEGNSMFCDFYNSSNKTYCKRLRVLCPEHSKDPKVSDNEVCGCPLMHNVFNYTGEFCRVAKKTCFKHYMWEKIRRAEIDLERVRNWLKMDELFEQERQIRTQMVSRAGVLGLMLHSTYNHDLMEDLYRKQQQQFAAAQKQQIRQIQQQQQQQQQQHQQQIQQQHRYHHQQQQPQQQYQPLQQQYQQQQHK